MHLLIAPNAFKNSLSAGEVAKAIRRGLDRSRLNGQPGTHPPYSSECFPVGDGGDGTGDLLIERLGGHRVEAEARDPLGRRIKTYWGLCSTPATLTHATPRFRRLLHRRYRNGQCFRVATAEPGGTGPSKG